MGNHGGGEKTFDRQNIISRKRCDLHPLYAILLIVPPSSRVSQTSYNQHQNRLVLYVYYVESAALSICFVAF
jgi:hypothetical protein